MGNANDWVREGGREGEKTETFVSCDICLLQSVGQEIFGLSVVSLCPVMHNPSQEKERIQALCLPEETSQRHSIIVDASLDLKKKILGKTFPSDSRGFENNQLYTATSGEF